MPTGSRGHLASMASKVLQPFSEIRHWAYFVPYEALLVTNQPKTADTIETLFTGLLVKSCRPYRTWLLVLTVSGAIINNLSSIGLFSPSVISSANLISFDY